MMLAVILAAGEASRMGEAKQLLDWQGAPLVCHVARQVLASGFDQVRLVLGAYVEEIRPWVAELDLEVVYNPDYGLGQSSSIRRGLAELDEQVQGVAFVLVDQPLVRMETYRELIAYFHQEKPGILIPTYQGQPGNPKIFHRKWVEELLQVTGDQGGRVLVQRHPEVVRLLEVADPGVLVDIDQKEDYLRLVREMDEFST